MPDFPALDVAIGLIFLYIILALVCSTINEALSTFVGLRARFLQLGLMNLLSAAKNPTAEGKATTLAVYSHPLIQTLIRPGHGLADNPRGIRGALRNVRRKIYPDALEDPTEITKWWRRPAPYPSYIPSRTFVAALTDLADQAKAAASAAEGETNVRDGEGNPPADASLELERSLQAIENPLLSEALLTIFKSANGNAEKFQHAAEQWFDDTMERVSGWYKRKTQLILAVLAAILVLVMNADTLTAARTLWRDDAMRAAVVKKAEALAVPSEAAAESGETPQPASPEDSQPVVDNLDEAVRQLDVPLGWNLSFGDEPTQLPNDWLAWLAKIVGWALTIGAIVLGAPFWFDLLSKIMRVRSTGSPPPASDAVRSGDADQSRAGPSAPPATG
jgi:hypothetical protein